MKLHLVDGTYELFRNHFGAPPREAPDGRPVGATVGLVRTLVALLREPEVTHVACAFDHVIESFRNDLFEGYKTGEGMDPDLFGQFAVAEEAARALGVAVWPMVEFEADDALATAAHRFGESVEQVVICSPDKDLTQCVRADRVVCLDRRRGKLFDEAAVIEKFGVAPASIPDWLALVGDSADGIPGLPRFGAKTAAKLLARWEHLDLIPEDPSDWELKVAGGAGLAQTLRERREDALLYRRLATLRSDVPLAESLEDLRWTGADADALEALGTALGSPGLGDRLA